MHTKAVLLINYRQSEFVKLHVFLKQGVGADDDLGLAIGDLFQNHRARLALLLAGKPGNLDAQGFEPVIEVVPVLLGEDFGGRHYRRLITACAP